MISTADIAGLRRLALLAGLLLAGSATSLAAPAGSVAEVVKVEFGIFDDDGTDQLGFGPTGDIPLSVGQPYGWLLQIRTTAKSLAVREELLRPEKDAAPAESPDTDLTPPTNRAALLGFNERRLPVQDGIAFGVRKVVAGDVPGRYRLKVFVERKLAATFDFVLFAPDTIAHPAAPQQTQVDTKPAIKPPSRSRRGSTGTPPFR